MNKPRLQQLIRLLKKIERSNLERHSADDPHYKGLGFDPNTWHCGTSACAIGFAGMAPVFNKQGFKIRWGSPTYNGLTDWEAVESFFDICDADSSHLFSIYSYPDSYYEDKLRINEVYERIEAFIS